MASGRAGRVGAALAARLRRGRYGLACGLVFSVLYALALPPVGLWFLAWFAPGALVWAGLGAHGRGIKRTAVWAAIGTAPLWALTHIWIGRQSELGLLPLVGYMALWPGVFVALLGLAVRRGVRGWWIAAVSPGLWVLLELIRGEVAFDGYAWFLAAHPLIDSPRQIFAQPAAWIGTYGVSALTVFVATLCALTIWRTCTRPAIAGASVLVVWAAVGSWQVSVLKPAERTMTVAVAQSNVAQDNRRAWTPRNRVASWFELRDLTLAAAKGDPDLIVWPEGMFPGRTLDATALASERASNAVWDLRPSDPEDVPELVGVPDYVVTTAVAEEFLAMSAELAVPLLVGSAGFDGYRWENDEGIIRSDWDAMYNSVFLVREGVVESERYDKLQLAPFGEVMPYISAWPWLEQQMLSLGARGMTFELSGGRSEWVFGLPEVARHALIATPVCFEVTVPRVCRRLVFRDASRSASLMVSMTQDGWFGGWTPGRRQYIQVARWRCVELRTPLVRAANTGISGAYGVRGEVLTETVRPIDGSPPIDGRDNVGGVLTAEVPLAAGPVLYALVGDWPAWGVGAVGVAVVVFAGKRRAERRPDEAKERAS